MIKLPENPMKPRLFDERVGYFSVNQIDFGREDEHRAPRRTYITRWRLEKKDPTAAISEPVKPIVYWIDSATPSKWVPYMRIFTIARFTHPSTMQLIGMPKYSARKPRKNAAGVPE